MNSSFTTFVEATARQLGISYSCDFGGSLIQLEKDGQVRLIQGNSIPINSSSSALVARDMAACSDILKTAGIAHIRRHVFLNPNIGDWAPRSGSWPLIHAYAAKHGYNIVCKAKEGDRSIHYAQTARDLEAVVGDLFRTSKTVELSVYRPFQMAYSFLIYNNQVEVVYKKTASPLTRAGKDIVKEYISSDCPEVAALSNTALKVLKAIGLRFGAVDIGYFPTDPKGKTFRVVKITPVPQFDERESYLYRRIISDLFISKAFQGEKSLQTVAVQIPTSDRREHTVAHIVSQIAAANGWTATMYSNGWITKLTQQEKVQVIWGYTFPLNRSAHGRVCTHKAHSARMLEKSGIPHVSHKLVSIDDPWEEIHNFGKQHDYQVVCKPAEGTAGIDVERAKTKKGLEKLVTKLFQAHKELVLCGFKKIHYEYRLIMLHGEAEIIFRKVPPYVSGDGVQSVRQLAAAHLEQMDPKRRAKLLPNVDQQILTSDKVAAKGDRVYLHWKHNLGQGALCELVGGKSYFEVMRPKEAKEDLDALQKMGDIAKRAVQALGLAFVSVDIIEEEVEGQRVYSVLEINSGIMMDNLMEQHGDKGVQLASAVYAKALAVAFSEESL